eukprot:s2288_g7.t1
MATVRDSGTACTPHLSTLQLQLLSASRVSLEPLQDAAAELVEGLDLFFQMLVLGMDEDDAPDNASHSPDCHELMAQITQQVLQEHLLEDKDSACDIVSEAPELGRFTSRLRRHRPQPPAAPPPTKRPGRLLGVQEPGSAFCVGTEELPALQHLAQLEQAVLSGSALPALPIWGQTGQGASPPPRSVAPKVSRYPALAAAHTSPLSPRLRPVRSPAQTLPLGFRSPNLRRGSGRGLARRGAVAAATALWISTEAQRLREEAQQPKSIGTSCAAAFLLNRGPELLEPLSKPLRNIPDDHLRGM